MKPIAQAQAIARGLKERLEQRGLTVVESISSGSPKITIGSEASIVIDSISVSSKDIIGQADAPFAPHVAKLAQSSACPAAEAAKIMLELAKVGVKVAFSTGASVAAAEAAAAEVLEYDVIWSSKGI